MQSTAEHAWEFPNRMEAMPVLSREGLDWLSGLLAPAPGEVLGYVVPPGSHRHDLRLLPEPNRVIFELCLPTPPTTPTPS